MNWLQKKFRKFLKIDKIEKDIKILNNLYSDLTTIGVDVHFLTPHMILIFSKLNGGQIRHIDVDFKDLRELNDFVKALKDRFRPKEIYWDMPLHLKNTLDQ